MPGIRSKAPYTCARCLRAASRHHARQISHRDQLRPFSQKSPLRSSQQNAAQKIEEEEESASIQTSSHLKAPQNPSQSSQNAEPEQGAMSRRLSQATEEALMTGGRSGRKAIEEAGFSEELKAQLLERIQSSNFRAENASAITEASLTSKIGRGSREIATGQAWTGTEARQDTILRMLDDTRQPLSPGLRGKARIPSPVVDLRLKGQTKARPGQRLANARDKTSIYAISKDTNLSEEEREEMRKELKERFSPASRTMPTSFSGLAALANERIEDAIARGQFKNIPRGKGIERDTRADNPFIDTTEYIMNKMIQRQEIVPPWIEKQQELVKTANIFRARLRNDWKRQAARTIASRGGTLQEQMRIAERYAEAEKAYNPKGKAVEQISIPTTLTSDPVMVNIIQVPETRTDVPKIQVEIENNKEGEVLAQTTIGTPPPDQQPIPTTLEPLPRPFRIPSWEAAETSYLTLAISNLNSLTRTYNLMAPQLAKKPYFRLDRELNSCYADIAPQLAQAIKERAARPEKVLVEKVGHRSGGVLDRFSGGERSVVYDSKKPLYGFREFWNDLWVKKAE